MMIKRLFILLLLALIVVGCQATNQTQLIPTETLPAIQQESSYPEPGLVIKPNPGLDSSAYPGPNNGVVMSGTLPIPPDTAPEPSPGNGSLSGILYSIKDKQILTLNPFFLTRGLGENSDTPPPFSVGPNESKGDIIGTTDEKGLFFLSSVPPGNYFLITWAAHDWPMAIVSPEDEAYRLIKITADEKHLLGVVYLP